ncbi:MAG TPA: acetylglutamate kinase [Fimbriimonadaceae bacterium]|jgi:acetylglutamate kinase
MSQALIEAMDTISPEQRANVLIEALPYLRQFFGKTIVIKYGGNAMTDVSLKDKVMKDVALLHYVGIRPILVHGGGPEINTLMDKMGCKSEFVDGLRVTDEQGMEIVEMALNKTNKGLVSLLNKSGASAVGLSGKDANLLIAKKMESESGADLGLVGDVVQVNASFLAMLADQGHVPVICSVATGLNGETYNVNADHAAGAIAAAMKATKLVVLTDVEGLYTDFSDKSTLVNQISASAAAELVSSGKAAKGMIPKIEACTAAVQSGVDRAHLIDGRHPHSILIEIFTDAGLGTMILPTRKGRPGMSAHLPGGFE